MASEHLVDTGTYSDVLWRLGEIIDTNNFARARSLGGGFCNAQLAGAKRNTFVSNAVNPARAL